MNVYVCRTLPILQLHEIRLICVAKYLRCVWKYLHTKIRLSVTLGVLLIETAIYHANYVRNELTD